MADLAELEATYVGLLKRVQKAKGKADANLLADYKAARNDFAAARQADRLAQVEAGTRKPGLTVGGGG